MAAKIKVAVYTNSDDAFVAWAPDDFIPECRGFQLERARKVGSKEMVEVVENRVGYVSDNPKSGDHKPSAEWPFQRFNWTDHAVDVGNQVRYRVTAMVDSGTGSEVRATLPERRILEWLATAAARLGEGIDYPRYDKDRARGHYVVSNAAQPPMVAANAQLARRA